VSSRGRPAPLPLPQRGSPADRIFSVSELTRGIRAALENAFEPFTVQGEVTGYKGPNPSSGHAYFSLKDANAQIDVVLYADRSTPAMRAGLQNGISVQIYGDITVYEKSGRYQIRAIRVEPVGYGALQAKYDALKRKLELEGLFSPDRKRSLPAYPTRIGIVTSWQGAALKDMVRILRTSAPYVQLVVADVRVQGEGAARDIAYGIKRMSTSGLVDVVIVGRGGGSIEDLWAFNEETVVRAIVASKIPVISAVGHETDTTLSDFAADNRAATPSHAAQIVVKDIREIRETLADMSNVARKGILRELKHERSKLDGFANHRAFREPAWKLRDHQQHVDRLTGDLSQALRNWVTLRREFVTRCGAVFQKHSPAHSFAHERGLIESCRKSLHQAAVTGIARRRERVESRYHLLESYDHHRVLERGYALVWSESGAKLRKRGLDLHPGDPIEVQFFDARAQAKVTDVKETS